MDGFKQHEQFEMEVLDRLNSARILPELIFGGGTMLRLCHGLDRYSVDLDFYRLGKLSSEELLKRCRQTLEQRFRLTDAADKRRTILLECSSPDSPRKVKIEINKFQEITAWKAELAWSPFSAIQVLVNAVTLSEMARMKVAALLDRQEIRDAFDLEFLLKKGIQIPGDAPLFRKLMRIIDDFSHQDFKVKLGSIVAADKRAYYVENRFQQLSAYCREKASEKPL